MRERGGRGTTDSTAASGIPFCPASWKQLENGCGMLGDRERQGERAGKKKVLAERANGEREREREASGKTKIDAFKVFPYPPLSGEGREAWKALRSCSPPPPLLSPPRNRPTNGGSRKYFKTFPSSSLLAISKPLPSSLASLPRLFYFPHLFFAVAANFSPENGRKTKKFAMIYHHCRLLLQRPRSARRRREKLVRS